MGLVVGEGRPASREGPDWYAGDESVLYEVAPILSG
jgi:hypothetical protein